MYQVTRGDKTKSALSMRQALYFAKDFHYNTKSTDSTTITLPDGCVLSYDNTMGDLVCQTPAPITFATSTQTAKILCFFFEAVERGWIDFSQRPQIKTLHDEIIGKIKCPHCGLPDADNNPYCFCKSVQGY